MNVLNPTRAKPDTGRDPNKLLQVDCRNYNRAQSEWLSPGSESREQMTLRISRLKLRSTYIRKRRSSKRPDRWGSWPKRDCLHQWISEDPQRDLCLASL